jgi:hypothetical protein
MAIRLNLDTVHKVATACEQGLNSASEFAQETLVYCAAVWMNGKLTGKCRSAPTPQYCLEDDMGLKAAIFTNLALMTFLLLASTTKQVSSSLRHKTTSRS